MQRRFVSRCCADAYPLHERLTRRAPRTRCARRGERLDAGDSAAFRAFFPGLSATFGRLASSFSCSQAESTPATAPQPKGLVRERKPLGAKSGVL
jgi:hypothetical protein